MSGTGTGAGDGTGTGDGTQVQDPPAGAAAAGAAGAGEGGAAAGTGGAGDPPPPGGEGGAPGEQGQQGQQNQDWRDRRIAVLTARLNEERARNAQQAPPPGGSGDAPAGGGAPAGTLTEDEVNRRAQALATQIAQAATFNEKCNATAEAGRAAFPDFDQKIGELKKLVDFSDPGQSQAYNQFLLAAIETGEGAKVIHALGGNLNEAMRIINLPPVKMGMELVRLSQRDPEAGAITGAPKPATQVRGGGSAHAAISPDDPSRADQLSTAEWMKRRQAQLAAKGPSDLRRRG